jgi:hypothetical protein
MFPRVSSVLFPHWSVFVVHLFAVHICAFSLLIMTSVIFRIIYFAGVLLSLYTLTYCSAQEILPPDVGGIHLFQTQFLPGN